MTHLNTTYTRRDTGATLPANAYILTGSRAQDYGLSPWADYMCVDGTGAPCEPWDAQGRDRSDVRFVEIDERLPEGAAEGDTAEMTVHGGSGSYTSWYTYQDGTWAEEGTTVPWQMRV